ncbi:hypothetical protein D3C73_1262250 [compost metagenome]
MARLQQQLVDKAALLGDLRLFQAGVRRLEEGAGILQVVVQKQAVEVDRQIIVVMHIAARVQSIIGLLGATLDPLHPGHLRRARTQGHLRGGQFQKVIDAAALDLECSIHEGFAQRQVRIGGDGDGRLHVGQHGRQFRLARPCRQLAAVGKSHPDRPRLKGSVQQGLQHPVPPLIKTA